ncbi:MAG: Mov34/MPN/PAD-1 family protein [Euryarchaeota archaeon]|nr:Mov34/MPN/PAD-1 family protein [Euryarchaeota archaeon]
MGAFDFLSRKGGPRGKSADPTAGKKRAPEGPPPGRGQVRAIERRTLELIFASSKSSHPHEFAAALSCEAKAIDELVLIPGTINGEAHAIMQLYMLPVDRRIVGSVHSHPGGNPRPSDADRNLFKNFGHIHIICAEPYGPGTWRAYDHNGESVGMTVVD